MLHSPGPAPPGSGPSAHWSKCDSDPDVVPKNAGKPGCERRACSKKLGKLLIWAERMHGRVPGAAPFLDAKA